MEAGSCGRAIYDDAASRQRLARLRAAMAEQNLDAFLVRDTSNIQWASAFDDVFDEERAHALYLCSTHAVLHTDSRYVTACEVAAQKTEIEVTAERESHAAFAAKQWEQRSAAACSGSLGIEDSLSLAEYRQLEKAFAKRIEEGASPSFVETSDLVVGLRAVKDDCEIARMRAAQAITDAAFAHIIEFIRPGLTEREVQLELEDYMNRHGGRGLAFPSIVASGANGASPHAIPGESVLEAGQCVVLDFGARAFGYCSDMTRTVFLGTPGVQMRSAYETIRRANEEVEVFLRPGVTGKQAHELAEHILEEGGFGGKMGHGLGHGVGIDIHEEPTLSPRNNCPLEVGNVVTVEPGIYLPGLFGMRLEDFGVITQDGFEVFTQSTHEMVIL